MLANLLKEIPYLDNSNAIMHITKCNTHSNQPHDAAMSIEHIQDKSLRKKSLF